MNRTVWATVITDASFCDKTKKAGWACWIRIDGIDHPIKRYGSFKEKVRKSTDAEQMAAVNGIFIAMKHGANAFLLQSDCMMVVHLIDGTTKSRDVIDAWNRKIARAGVLGMPIRAKHVRGHTRTRDARSYVNRWCDEKANIARKQA